jgi:hypothetical protein
VKGATGGLEETMVMCGSQNLQIEDLRNHPTETMMLLRDALASGADILPDPKRPGFYEMEADGRVYYFNVARPSGKILLLATWPSEHALEERTMAECGVA